MLAADAEALVLGLLALVRPSDIEPRVSSSMIIHAVVMGQNARDCLLEPVVLYVR